MLRTFSRTNPIVAKLIAAMLAVLGILVIAAILFPAKSLAPAYAPVEKVAVLKGIHVAARARNGAFQPTATADMTTLAPSPPRSGLQPLISRTATVSLYAGNVQAAVHALSSIARANGGDVFSLDVSSADSDSGAGAQMEIHVPAAQFTPALSAIARVGRVREQSVSASDLTGNMTDSSAHLRNLLQTEADIRKIMDRSGNVSQVMAAETQLSDVRGQIEALESDISTMRNEVAYSTITLNVSPEIAPAPVTPNAASQLVEAWRAATGSLGQFAIRIVAAAVWALVFSPLVLLAIVAAWVLMTRVRSRGEAAG